MKKFLPIIIFSFCVCLFSCKSVNSFVPGQKKIQINNLYTEYYNIAETYYSLKNYSKAISYYKICLENKDLYNASYYKLGLSYVMNNEWANAEKIFLDLYKKDSENDSIKSSLAYIYSMNGNLEKAEQFYCEIVKTKPDSSEYLENYIAILIKNEKYQLVEEQLILLKEKFPNSTKIADIEKKLKELNSEKESTESEENLTELSETIEK